MSSLTLAARLESYTIRHPNEVLVVHVESEGGWDQIIIFKGFSSSLMRPTAFDPEVPVLTDSATVSHIDRLQGPYQPNSPHYLEQNISLNDFLSRLPSEI